MICKGYKQANNKFLKSRNPSKSLTHILDLDANNLYGHSMMQLLPFEMIDWVDPEEFNLGNCPDDSPIGCLLETEIDYPDELHDLHSTLGVEKKELNKSLNINYESYKTMNFFLVKTKILFLI